MLLEFVRTLFPGLLSSELEFRSSSIGGLFFLLLVEEGLAFTSSAAQFGGVLRPLALRLPRLPFPLAPPLFLLCSPLDSVKLTSAPGAAAADLALFPLPRPPRISRSLVGDSQNLGGAQSCLVQSRRVPTYVLFLHVTLTTRTPGGESGGGSMGSHLSLIT